MRRTGLSVGCDGEEVMAGEDRRHGAIRYVVRHGEADAHMKKMGSIEETQKPNLVGDCSNFE